MAHFALQKLHIRPIVLIGEGSGNDPVMDKERAFIFASIMERCEEEKRQSDKLKAKGGRK